MIPLLAGSFEIAARQPRKKDRIFPTSPTYVSVRFHRYAEALGIQDIVLHDLRHEGISRMFEAGYEIQEVAIVSGHRDWKMLRRYTHIRPSWLIEKALQLTKKRASEDALQTAEAANHS